MLRCKRCSLYILSQNAAAIASYIKPKDGASLRIDVASTFLALRQPRDRRLSPRSYIICSRSLSPLELPLGFKKKKCILGVADDERQKQCQIPFWEYIDYTRVYIYYAKFEMCRNRTDFHLPSADTVWRFPSRNLSHRAHISSGISHVRPISILKRKVIRGCFQGCAYSARRGETPRGNNGMDVIYCARKIREASFFSYIYTNAEQRVRTQKY